MQVDRIVLNDQNKLTSDERDLQMLKAIEKQLGTGPIIGEAREVVLTMSRNIMIRDLVLDSMNVPVEVREKMFRYANEYLAEQDKKILEKRAKNA